MEMKRRKRMKRRSKLPKIFLFVAKTKTKIKLKQIDLVWKRIDLQQLFTCKRPLMDRG